MFELCRKCWCKPCYCYRWTPAEEERMLWAVLYVLKGHLAGRWTEEEDGDE